MKIKGIKNRLKALKPLEKNREPPKWCYDYVKSIPAERWKAISEALRQFKQGIAVNTEVLGDDREFYERVIEAGKEGIIEL